ncbi:MAG: ribosome recycling factor [Candidatus Marinimicrobia bacterium]|nr:ribosome recycling factor [Candidatus Neomarinimicrobiota bacterium]MCF7904590.1 ribosome recycling factor [Candidatus Neomarinimicrobiota bacterium]
MINELFKDVDHRMQMSVEHVKQELSGLRSSRASITLVEHVKVQYYGNPTPLNQVANLSVPEPRLIVIQPWEKSLTAEIEKAIMSADLGLNPQNDGVMIRIPIPPLTDERRKELIRHVHQLAEESRIGIRNIRRDANEQIKKAEKDHELSEDNAKRAVDNVQEMTDKYIKQIDEASDAKETDIMEV